MWTVIKIINFHSGFLVSETITQRFSCVFKQYSGVLITSMKKNLEMWLLSWEIKPESSPEMQKKSVSCSLSSMQQHLPIYFSDNFVRKCCILPQNYKIMLGIHCWLEKSLKAAKLFNLVTWHEIGSNFSIQYLENQSFGQKDFAVFLMALIPKRYLKI